jgi:hypothetical protein
MRVFQLTKSALICSMILAGIVSITACSEEDKLPTASPSTSQPSASSSTVDPLTSVSDVSPTPSLAEIAGTLKPNDIAITWVENVIVEKTMYVDITDGYLKIRKGPGKDYEQIGTLTNDMPVIVIALTESNWYKTKDGFYVSGEYMSDTL